MRRAFLWIFAAFIGYRFKDDLVGETLNLPCQYVTLDPEKIRSKAGASLNAAGVFLALTIAIFAAAMSSSGFATSLNVTLESGWYTRGDCVVIVILLYLVIRQERVLSRNGKKVLRYLVLILLLALSAFVFMVGPFCVSRWPVISRFVSDVTLRPVLPVAGFLLAIVAAFFEVFAMEFYDSASGWRGGDKVGGTYLRFHLASLASHAFLFGVCFAILSVPLLFAQIHFWVGSVLTIVALFVLVLMTEIERELWNRKEP